MVGVTANPQGCGAGDVGISGLGAALTSAHAIAIACPSRQPGIVVTGDIGADGSECAKVGAACALAPLNLEIGFIRRIIIPGQIDLG